MAFASSERVIQSSFLGRVPYLEALELQIEARTRLLEGTADAADTLLLLEHPPVVTLGRNAQGNNATGDELIWGAKMLKARGFELVMSDRGGQATYHGPGQLVGYPIFDLKPDRRDIRRYVRNLEKTLIDTLCELGVRALHSDGDRPIGVWVEHYGQLRKIASIGVHLKRWVTTHGFALNITTDLTHFQAINPCGMPSETMTSVEALLGVRYELGQVAEIYKAKAGAVFGARMEPLGLAR